MADDTVQREVHLPEALRSKLERFQRRVWVVKAMEGGLAAVFGLGVSYLVVFSFDRFADTPAALRGLILAAGALGLGLFFPLTLHRWVWRTRTMEQVARLLRHRFPRLGDHLLGVIELAHSRSELRRSETLVQAAIRQVDAEVAGREFTDAVPSPRHRRWAWIAGSTLAVAASALIVVPTAATNALARWLMPWRDTPRFTFARLEELPDHLVVPYAEPFELSATLSEDSRWSPGHGKARYAGQAAIVAELESGDYRFRLPPQRDAGTLAVAVGDARQRVAIEPVTRPELVAMIATVELPAYLEYAEPITQDVRGGSVSVVKGSRARFEASASRSLAEAAIDGTPQRVEGAKLRTDPMPVMQSFATEFTWRDELGLTSKSPLVLKVNALEDEAPAVYCKQLERQQVVLSTEVLSFGIRSEDDFGIKLVGLEWVGVQDILRNPEPGRGEKIVAAGGPEQREVEAVATFSAQREGVRPQTLRIRAYAEDLLPGRERTYSPVYVLHVLSPEEHAIWVTEQLARWLQRATDVYEREEQLHDANRALRALDAAELDRPEVRRRIESQAQAERANATRLEALTEAGRGLIEKATRNDQFNAATLETWAEMLARLQDIAGQRMPSVADLLAEAAEAPGQAKPGEQSPGGETPPTAASVKSAKGGGQPSEGPPQTAPGVADVESGSNDTKEGPPSGSGPGRLGLPGTTVQGGGAEQEPGDAPPPAGAVDEAVEQQADLLAEFEKVREELQKILGNLEGSTFVKRLKAASRRQLELAGDLNRSLTGSFGLDQVEDRVRGRTARLAEREIAQSESVYRIQEDLEAYAERKQEPKFRGVLEQMKEAEVVGQIRDIGETVTRNLNGQSIATAEYWSDALDRWAELLVGPGDPGGEPGPAENSDSLPPSVVLEVMRILGDEIQLREETRSLEQARRALAGDEYGERAVGQTITQLALLERTLDVTDDIRRLPQGGQRFTKEIALLTRVAGVMGEAQEILSRPDTGPMAVAAETEAIELLLQTRRMSSGGGGGGSSPGGGGTGTTEESALAKVGPGTDRDAKITDRQVDQSTGVAGRNWPEEYRSGLDSFFHAMEGSRPHGQR